MAKLEDILTRINEASVARSEAEDELVDYLDTYDQTEVLILAAIANRIYRERLEKLRR